jgi:hypothetical protein
MDALYTQIDFGRCRRRPQKGEERFGFSHILGEPGAGNELVDPMK